MNPINEIFGRHEHKKSQKVSGKNTSTKRHTSTKHERVVLRLGTTRLRFVLVLLGPKPFEKFKTQCSLLFANFAFLCGYLISRSEPHQRNFWPQRTQKVAKKFLARIQARSAIQARSTSEWFCGLEPLACASCSYCWDRSRLKNSNLCVLGEHQRQEFSYLITDSWHA